MARSDRPPSLSGGAVARGLALGLALVMSPAQAEPGVTASPQAGRIEGVQLWKLPSTPNGLVPSQSWHATGSAPNGDLYVAGMDHRTNAALYRLPTGRDDLRLVGDARSASEAAGNWRPGETAEKFHTRPTFMNGKVYVATMDSSGLDADYKAKRGFHWYAYDPDMGHFTDLSAREKGGTGLPHGSVVTLAADPARKALFGAIVPTGEVVRYDATGGVTASLGRPGGYDRPFLYVNRFMFTDAKGRLYGSAGAGPGYAAGIYAHLYRYEPGVGPVPRPDLPLVEPRALETGRCFPDRQLCFAADSRGHLYRFSEDAAGDTIAWTAIGQVTMERPGSFLWMFQVDPAGATAYAAATSYAPDAGPASLYEVDLATGRSTRLCSLADLDPRLGALNVHTGYDAWDAQGRFAFASFAGEGESEVLLTRVDPARLKAALRARCRDAACMP
ncbi:hypothetical protein [Methylorubrum extorquens]|uniref:hypothetical protein n=1 Tax=Methylorubrum extorquens TaxID=408 RepID=UPI0020A1FE98|nr:hypothetical protein [Methylorubrum extorquens]MCP1535744.1 hypothetical protein [Methylorubrum extorquens]